MTPSYTAKLVTVKLKCTTSDKRVLLLLHQYAHVETVRLKWQLEEPNTKRYNLAIKLHFRELV